MVQTKCGFDGTPDVSGQNLLSVWGPTLNVSIGFDETYDVDKVPVVAPKPAIENVVALVDTGAGESCIDSILAAEIKLPIVNRRMISGVQGKFEVNVYLAQIYVPSLNQTIYGNFAGVNLQDGGQPHKALIGRSFLQHFTMVYEGRTGTVIIHND